LIICVVAIQVFVEFKIITKLAGAQLDKNNLISSE